MNKINFLSIDVEDWYHLLVDVPETWDSLESRVAIGVNRILDILDRYSVQATFFVLGYVAGREPDLIRKIHDKGHEIASHGYYHNYVYRMSPEEFKKDVESSVDILEKIANEKIYGFRASSFSIDERCLWAFEIMENAGIRYDSSVMPAKTFYYGMDNAQPWPHRIGPKKKIVEVPPSIASFPGKKLPALGGFPLRFMPNWWNRALIRRINRKGHRAHVYLHPWELDTEQKRMKLTPRWRFVRYYNLSGTESKFIKLLEKHEFGPIGRLLDENPVK